MIVGELLAFLLKYGFVALLCIFDVVFTIAFVKGLRLGRFAKGTRFFRTRVDSDFAYRDKNFSEFLRIAGFNILAIALTTYAVYAIALT